MIYAIDEGFDTVVASDASGGYPRSYGDEVLLRTIRPFPVIATVDEVIAAWARATPAVAGASDAEPTPGVIESIRSADLTSSKR